MSEQQSRCPVIHFDHHSPEHAADTVGAYSKLRSESPGRMDRVLRRLLVLSNYKSVFEASRNDDLFSSARHDEYGGEGLSVTIPKAPTASTSRSSWIRRTSARSARPSTRSPRPRR